MFSLRVPVRSKLVYTFLLDVIKITVDTGLDYGHRFYSKSRNGVEVVVSVDEGIWVFPVHKPKLHPFIMVDSSPDEKH